MSRVVMVCLRDPARTAEFEAKLRRLSSLIVPDNITPHPPVIAVDGGVLTATYNPASTVRHHGASVCLGMMIAPSDDWHQPGAAIPDGTFALFRSDGEQVELCADMLASRTIWHAQTDEVFIASSSQRAIVALLGDFQMNNAVLPWMLSMGALGPGNSWDKRIHLLTGNSRLRFDRRTWKASIETESGELRPPSLTDDEHRARMKAILDSVFGRLDLDYAKWVMTLSGGIDSRLVFLFMKNRQQLPCIGYGLREARDDLQGDAYLGKRVAEHYGAPYRYFELDIPGNLSVESLLSRFLAAGEGRVDHVSSYMDGFSHWKILVEEGIEGVVRGDQNFGRPRSYTAYDARSNLRLYLLSDFANLKNYRDFELAPQALPDDLLRRRGESLSAWTDRLYREYRYPVVMAALNELKTGYVEVLNPLIANSIIRGIRELPDHIRESRRLIRAWLSEFGPDIPIATRRAQQERKSIVHLPDAVELFQQELRSPTAQRLFSERLIRFLQERTVATDTPLRKKPRRWYSKYLPARVKSLRRVLASQVDYNVLALRAYIISRTVQMLTGDASALKD